MKTAEKPDYSKVCWFCGQPAVLPAGDWFRCSECGTTWNKVIHPGVSCITEEKDKFGQVVHYHSRARRLPDGRPPEKEEG